MKRHKRSSVLEDKPGENLDSSRGSTIFTEIVFSRETANVVGCLRHRERSVTFHLDLTATKYGRTGAVMQLSSETDWDRIRQLFVNGRN